MLSIGEFARLGQVSPRTLRHYDDRGILVPARVDVVTGYRSYEVGQLARLHQILALRDLGFALDQIGVVLDGRLGVEELRGMLLLRRAQIEASVTGEQARLRRVEAHLRALERGTSTRAQDVVLKQSAPLRIAEAAATAAGFGPLLGDVFAELYPRVIGHLNRAGARPGLCVAWYEEPNDDGTVVVHAGFDIGSQVVPNGEAVLVVELPAVEVAALVHHGRMDDVASDYEALVQWIDDSGYRLGGRSRELYRERDDDDPARNVTELQMPISR